MSNDSFSKLIKLPVLLLASALESIIIVRAFPNLLPNYTFSSLFWRFLLLQYLFKVFWRAYLYPIYFSPLRHLPGPKGLAADGVLFEHPRGLRLLKWLKTIPNDGLLLTRSFDGKQYLFITSPEILADVLVHRSYEFEKPFIVRNFLARILGWALIASEGDQHRMQRKALTPAFNVRNIRGLYPLMWDKATMLANILEREIRKSPSPLTAEEEAGSKAVSGELNISEWTSRLTLDIIGPAAMGRDFQTLQNDADPVATNYLEIFQPSIRRVLFFILSLSTPPWFAERWPSSTNRSMKKNMRTIRAVCLDIVREKKQELASTGTGTDGSSDILSEMLRGKEINDAACVDQMLTFLAAGHETTASALSWTCYLLCKYPAVQTELRRELHEHLDPSAPITAAALESLPLLNGVCNEVLRLYPTVPITVREATSTTTLAGVAVPKGTWLMLCPWATNRDPALWGADAEEFRPERWIEAGEDGIRRPNNSGGAKSNYGMLTFLHGPRSCIGQGFAKAEMRCAVAVLVGRFGMTLARPGEEVRSVGAVTSKPKEGIDLRLKLLRKWCEDI